MMTFDVQLSGGQVGYRIADDPEEFWQLLQAMVEVNSLMTEAFAEEVADYAGCTRPISDKVVELLYLVAAKIEAAHHG